MKLTEDGWDMQQRIAQLNNHPGDVATLRALLPAVGLVEPGEPQTQALAAPARPEEAAVEETFFPWLDGDRDDGPLGGHAPG